MNMQYTCKVIKYDEGDEKSNVMFILDFDVEAQVLRGYVYQLLNAIFYIPLKPIEYIDTHVGDMGQFVSGILSRKLIIQLLGQDKFVLVLPKEEVPGGISQQNLDEIGFGSLDELFQADVKIGVIFTNFSFGSKNNKETGSIHVTNIKVIKSNQ